MASKKNTICIDFDGVISKYDKWMGKGVFGEVLPGAKEYISRLKEEEWIIIIHTTRSEKELIIEYLKNNGISFDYINYNPENVLQGCSHRKPLATVYLDDRGLTFDGNWEESYNRIKNFEVWYRR